MPSARIFAPSVYVGASDSVNANISSPACSPSHSLSLPSLYAACERAGIAPRDLAGFLYDRLSQHPDGGACPQGTVGPCPPSTLDVLRALLSHANREHDRVFASQKCLAAETGKGETTVGAVISWLRSVGALRRIDDPEELLAGDGPHRAALRGIKRRGRHPVNTYDLSPLLAFLPSWLRRLMVRALEAIPEEPAAVIVETSDPFPDPFTDSVEGHDSGSAAPSVAAVCNVSREKSREPEKAPNGRRGFLPQKSGARNREGRAAPSRESREAVAASREAVKALRAAGVDYPVAVRMVADKGAAWCADLLRYGRREGAKRGPGYLVRVWQEWEGWPDDFAAARERETAARARVVQAPTVRPAVRIAAPPAAPEAPPPAALVRGMLRRYGEGHPLVRALTARLLRAGDGRDESSGGVGDV